MKKIITLIVIALGLYGLGRVYYNVTDGFLLQNIAHAKNYDPRYDIELTAAQIDQVKGILKTPFYYLGKGCQSYVFEDVTKTYVIKFLKYQRYRTKTLLTNFDFIPWVDRYCKTRADRKLAKIDNVYRSWKTALVMAPEETGVLFVHLNKEVLFDQPLTIYDKVGMKHEIDLNVVEFLIQKKAQLLQPYLKKLVANNQLDQAKTFLDGMLARILSGFQRGISDNDYALIQNTGVSQDQAVYIDVGQIIYNPLVKDPAVYRKELFNKTYKFSVWLKELSPALADHFQERLVEIIGPDFYTMPPYVNKSNMGDIPNLF